MWLRDSAFLLYEEIIFLSLHPVKVFRHYFSFNLSHCRLAQFSKEILYASRNLLVQKYHISHVDRVAWTKRELDTLPKTYILENLNVFRGGSQRTSH